MSTRREVPLSTPLLALVALVILIAGALGLILGDDLDFSNWMETLGLLAIGAGLLGVGEGLSRAGRYGAIERVARSEITEEERIR